MPARVRAAAVVGLVLVLLGLGAGPAVAEPGSPIVVSNVGTAPGKLSLVLTGSGLPEQAALAGGALTVSVEGTQLPVEVTSAASLDPAELPIRSVVLVVETGESTAGAPLVAMEIAVFNYLDRLPADVAAGLVTVSDQARVVAAPTHERTAVRTGAGSLSAGGASALYDAVLLAAGQFDVTSTERRVVLLADGPDQGSQATAGTVATALRDQRVVLD
ncbi:MAG: VWA domain-containing protein, partial [Dactylosporangium sp.]|nr:VWA domain-containing protein [Dactylosporangium sp.]NNJ63852.1 VWA domain-containing protein [Dactylosporangium sp.]